MNACSRYPCGWYGTGCSAQNCPQNPSLPFTMPSIPSPRTMPVNIPFSNFGVTVVTMDRDGNVTIKLDQVPSTPQECGAPNE